MKLSRLIDVSGSYRFAQNILKLNNKSKKNLLQILKDMKQVKLCLTRSIEHHTRAENVMDKLGPYCCDGDRSIKGVDKCPYM